MEKEKAHLRGARDAFDAECRQQRRELEQREVAASTREQELEDAARAVEEART